MNKKAKAVAKGIAAGATFAVAVGDIIDAFAKRTNHPAWYGHYPVNNLVNLNFGQRENLNPAVNQMTLGQRDATHVAKFHVPTDAKIEVELTIPHAKGENVLEKASALVLQQLRSVATTTAPYTKEQAGYTILNARSIVAFYSILRRLSGEVNITDAYDADAYFKYAVMGVNDRETYANIMANIAEIRAGLGAVTPLIRNLIPVNIDLIERTKWIFSNIFADSPSAKFSTKQFTCDRFTMWDENGVKHIFTYTTSKKNVWTGEGTTATPYVLDSNNARVHVYSGAAQWLPMLRAMIEFMTNQSSTSRILGDMLKAFGQRAFMDFPDLDSHARTPVVYDQDVLCQVQNLVMASAPTPFIDQMTEGCLAPGQVYAAGMYSEHVVTTYRDTISAEQVMAMTRLSPYQDYTGVSVTQTGGSNVKLYEITTCGTEIVVMYSWLFQTSNEGCTYVPLGDTHATNTLLAPILWAMDDYAPMLMMNSSGSESCPMIDAQNWALMRENDQAVYTTYASLSLFMIHELVQKADTFVFVQ